MKETNFGMDAQNCSDHPQLKPSIVLTGTANEGSAGPPIGLVDIGISDSAFLFRVALPSIRKDKCKFGVFIYHVSLLCPTSNNTSNNETVFLDAKRN